MITGDHVTTAGAIADQLGIEGAALSGTDFAALSDAEVDEQVEGIGVSHAWRPRTRCASSRS